MSKRAYHEPSQQSNQKGAKKRDVDLQLSEFEPATLHARERELGDGKDVRACEKLNISISATPSYQLATEETIGKSNTDTPPIPEPVQYHWVHNPYLPRLLPVDDMISLEPRMEWTTRTTRPL